MAQIAQISILDGQATPVVHVFKRMPSTQPNIVAFRDSTVGLVVAQRVTLTGNYRPSASNNDGAKRTWLIQVPEYDSETKKVISTARVKIEVLMPDTTSDGNKKFVAALLKNFSASTDVSNELVLDDPVI